MRCTDCKKDLHEFHSAWDRFRLFLLGFFHEDLIDIRTDFFTKGYGEGYESGFRAAKGKKPITQSEINELVKTWEN